MIEIRIIDRDRCPAGECMMCVDACPEDVLTLSEGIIEVVNIKKCLDCGVCQEVCPGDLFIFERS